MLQFFKNENYVLKITSRNSALYKFHINIYLESFIFTYLSFTYLHIELLVHQ